MSARYCPDCGAENRPDDTTCGECSFPLQLQVTSSAQKLLIEKNQVPNWQRIAQLLRRNGIKIQTVAGASAGSAKWWWALPAAGFLFFMATLIFGRSWADQIWEPPRQQAPVLDLSQTGTNQQGQLPPAENTGEDVDTSFLKDALSSSKDQEYFTQDNNLDTSDFVDLPEAAVSDIENWAKQAILVVGVKKRRMRGTVLTLDGKFITGSTSLSGAFEREIRTIETDGKIEQKARFVLPMANIPGSDPAPAQKELDGLNTGITLLRGTHATPFDFEIEYDRDLDLNNTIYIGAYLSKRHFLIKGTISGNVVNHNQVGLWLAETDLALAEESAGSPVFNAQGRLAGIVLFFEGQMCILSMKRLRERAPQIFREVI